LEKNEKNKKLKTEFKKILAKKCLKDDF